MAITKMTKRKKPAKRSARASIVHATEELSEHALQAAAMLIAFGAAAGRLQFNDAVNGVFHNAHILVHVLEDTLEQVVRKRKPKRARKAGK